MFQVLYIGRIKLWEKKVPDSFIDEALEKFKEHELEKHKSRQIGNIGKLKSDGDILAKTKVSRLRFFARNLLIFRSLFRLRVKK